MASNNKTSYPESIITLSAHEKQLLSCQARIKSGKEAEIELSNLLLQHAIERVKPTFHQSHHKLSNYLLTQQKAHKDEAEEDSYEKRYKKDFFTFLYLFQLLFSL